MEFSKLDRVMRKNSERRYRRPFIFVFFLCNDNICSVRESACVYVCKKVRKRTYFTYNQVFPHVSLYPHSEMYETLLIHDFVTFTGLLQHNTCTPTSARVYKMYLLYINKSRTTKFRLYTFVSEVGSFYRYLRRSSELVSSFISRFGDI